MLLVWLTFIAVVVLGLRTSSVTGLLSVVLTCDTLLLVALLLTDVRKPRTADETVGDLPRPAATS